MPTQSPRAVAGLAMLSLGFFDGILGVAWLGVYRSLDAPIESLGWVLAAVGLGSAVGSALAPFMLRHVSHLSLLACALWMQALCMGLIGLSAAFWAFALFYGIRGLFNGIAHAALNAFFAPRISARHLMNVHGGWGLGTASAGLLAGVLLDTGFSWVIVYLFGAVISALAGWMVWQGASRFGHLAVQPSLTGVSVKALSLPVLGLLIAGALYVGLEQGVGNWLSTWVVSTQGVSLASAGALTAMFWGGLTLGRFSLNRLPGDETQVLKGSAVIITLGIACLPVVPVSWLWLCVGVIGVSMAPVAPFVLTAVSLAVPAHRRDAVMAWQILGFSAGAATLPALYGLLAEAFSLQAIPLGFLASAALLLGLFWLTLNRLR